MFRNNSKIKDMRKSILLICIFFLVLSACEESLLEKDQPGVFTEDQFYKTEEDALFAVNAAYEQLSFRIDKGFSDVNRLWVLGDIVSDDAITGNQTQPDVQMLDDFSTNADNENVEVHWQKNYEGITQCNIVLEKIPDIEMDDALKERILGEAYFLRGYYYFLLIESFGGVPLILEPKNASELKIPRATAAETWERIESDCSDAIDRLPASYDAENTGRATKGAATALLAKVFLFQEKWQEAVNTAALVESIGNYALMSNYSDNFNISTENNQESVWEIQHMTGASPRLGNALNQICAPQLYGGGWQFNLPTQDFVDEFEGNDDNGTRDPRLDFTIGRPGNDWFGGTYPANGSYSETGYSPKKYIQPTDESPARVDGGLNFTAIRFAEVLLLQAEALAELNMITEAEIVLERIRARARAQAEDPVNALPPVTGLSKTEMINAIRHERRVELGFEGQRFFDLVRWGIASDVMIAHGKIGFESGKHELFPIPQRELDLNPNLVQNPNY